MLIDVLAMQQLQCDPDPGQLFVHRVPIRLGIHALVFTAMRKHHLIHLGLGQLGKIIPLDVSAVYGFKHGSDTIARDAMPRSNGSG